MDCQKYLELISLYIDGELNKEEQEEVIEHMKQCESCKKEYESLNEMVKELRNTQFLPLPEGYHETLMKKVLDTKIEKIDFTNKKRKNNWGKYATLVAGLCVVAVVGANSNNAILNNNDRTYENTPFAQAQEEDGIEAGSQKQLMRGNSSMPMADTAMTEEAPMASAMNAPKPEDMVAPRAAATGGEVNETAPVVNDVAIEGVIVEERKKIKTGNIAIEVENFEEITQSIKNEAESIGGYVQNFNSYVYYEDKDNNISLKCGSISIRVDKNQYDLVRNNIKAMGKVSREDEYVEDITSQYVDTQGQLKAKKVEEERLLVLLGKAENVQDIVSIEERLSNVRGYIESYQSMINNWDKLVEFSTINVEITEEMPAKVGTIPSDFGDKIKDSFIKSVNFLVTGFQNMVLGIVAMSMPLIAVAVVVVFVVIIVRSVLKKSKKKKE